MTNEAIATLIHDRLFSVDGTSVYAVLDGASIPDLLEALVKHQPEYECLFRGELAPDMAEVAPYLVHLEPDSDFTNWVVTEGWGNHWGIFVVADEDLRAMRRHFRTFLVVYDNNGKPLHFRYYDPRVLRVYLPTCNAEELQTVFGPVIGYLLEDEDPNVMLCFQAESGALKQEKKALTEGAN
jgi:Domain of unknown function (DUF4123)